LAPRRRVNVFAGHRFMNWPAPAPGIGWLVLALGQKKCCWQLTQAPPVDGYVPAGQTHSVWALFGTRGAWQLLQRVRPSGRCTQEPWVQNLVRGRWQEHAQRQRCFSQSVKFDMTAVSAKCREVIGFEQELRYVGVLWQPAVGGNHELLHSFSDWEGPACATHAQHGLLARFMVHRQRHMSKQLQIVHSPAFNRSTHLSGTCSSGSYSTYLMGQICRSVRSKLPDDVISGSTRACTVRTTQEQHSTGTRKRHMALTAETLDRTCRCSSY
jgi:hypothetical protein